MTESVMMDELTWQDYAQRVQRGSPVLIVAGSTEQHGPHLPLGTDVIQGMAIARAIAERTGGIVAPPIAYGYKSQPKSGGGESFVGTTSLDAQTLIWLVHDIIRAFARHGVRRLVFIDGHYENAMFLTEGIDLALRERASDGLHVLVFHWWELISQTTIDDVFGGEFPGWALEHAAVIETSVTAAVRPEVVNWDRLVDDRAERLPSYDIFPAPPDIIPRSGVLSPARRANPEYGRRMVEEVVAAVVERMKSEFQL